MNFVNLVLDPRIIYLTVQYGSKLYRSSTDLFAGRVPLSN